jgi:hypothetical protein
MSSSNAKLSADDRLDIIELFAKYAWAIDPGDADGVLQCFAEDALLDHLRQGQMVGHEKIRRAFEELWYDRPSWWIGRRHSANHVVMESEGEGARIKAFFSILQSMWSTARISSSASAGGTTSARSATASGCSNRSR